jgi:hypothetical protein
MYESFAALHVLLPSCEAILAIRIVAKGLSRSREARRDCALSQLGQQPWPWCTEAASNIAIEARARNIRNN